MRDVGVDFLMLMLMLMLMLSEKSVGRVEARAFKIAPTASSQCTLNTLMRGKRGAGEGEVPHVHVMIATLPIAATLGELVGVCADGAMAPPLNQSPHSRVRPPPPFSFSLGEPS